MNSPSERAIILASFVGEPFPLKRPPFEKEGKEGEEEEGLCEEREVLRLRKD